MVKSLSIQIWGGQLDFTSSKDATLHGLKVLTYGDSGVGKTYLIKTLPDHERILIISAESGLLTIADVDIATKVVSTIEEVKEVYAYLYNNEDEVDRTLAEIRKLAS